MKSVIITGANGFIGSNLCNYLSSLGIKVYAIVHENRSNNIKINENVTILSDNDNDHYSDIYKNMDEIDVFYHFAWEGVFGEKSKDTDIQIKNIKKTCDVVKIAKKIKCKKFIFSESVMSYNCFETVMKDYSKPSMRNIYYSSKGVASIMAKTLCQKLGVEYIGITISNVYGPGSNLNNFMNSMLIKMIKGDSINFFSGNNYYDFIYIDDAVKGLSLLGENGEPNCSYYMGSDHPKTVKEYTLLMKEYSKSSSVLTYESNNTPDGIDISKFEIDKLSKKLDFEYKIDFKKGVLNTINWLKTIVN